MIVVIVVVLIQKKCGGEHSYMFDYDYSKLEVKLMVVQCGVEHWPIYVYIV